ncbi:MAG: hypothetical protein WCV58_01445 [Patescibacteria group bacterium]|jgi:hypothetical protein
MGENLTIPEDSVEENENIYPSVSEYLSAFEQSSQFDEAIAQRERDLKLERPDINLSKEDLVESMRLSPDYRYTLVDFHRAGNKLPTDLEVYGPEAQEAIQAYWKYIESMPNHIDIIRATARDKDDEVMKLFRMEKTRDKFHTLAGLELLGKGVMLENGQKITCDEFTSDESAMDLASYSILGRALVSIITEGVGLDVVDPKREEAKTVATLNFLNDLQYSSGHWVAKGEK